MNQFVKQAKGMGFDGINDFPTVGVIDDNFPVTMEETSMDC